MNSNLYEMGSSNKFFYYTGSGINSFNITLVFTFEKDINLEALKRAANTASNRYPELSGRPVIVNNRIMLEKNEEPVAFIKKDDKVRHFGTDEVNGYLYYFMYEGREVTFSYYHGVSDVIGIMAMIRCMMYLYAKETGFELSAEELAEIEPVIRLKDSDRELAGEVSAYNPYDFYGKKDALPAFAYDNKGAFEILTSHYPEDADYFNLHIIRVATSAVLSKTKEYSVSVVPMLNDMFSLAIREEFGAGDMPVITLLPVNIRPTIDSDTKVNCSDAVFIPFTQEDEKLTIEERCKKWKEFLVKQNDRAFFEKTMANKSGAVKAFENDERSIFEIAKERNRLLPVGAKRPISYGLTYPGKMTLSSGLDRMLEDFELLAYTRGNAIIGNSFRDEMRIQVLCRTDEKRLPNCILKSFEKMGLDAKMECIGHVYPDLVMLDELKSYSI